MIYMKTLLIITTLKLEISEHEHMKMNMKEKCKEDGYTDTYPDDSSENIEMSDVNLENNLLILAMKKSKLIIMIWMQQK